MPDSNLHKNMSGTGCLTYASSPLTIPSGTRAA
jgi:hypothetical protein